MAEKIWAIAKTRFEALHQWKDAPEEVEFLKYSHRHEFHVTVYVSQTHVDRDVEFITLKRLVNTYLMDKKEVGSCEMVAEELGKWLEKKYAGSHVIVEVFEDGENGARIEL